MGGSDLGFEGALSLLYAQRGLEQRKGHEKRTLQGREMGPASLEGGEVDRCENSLGGTTVRCGDGWGVGAG